MNYLLIAGAGLTAGIVQGLTGFGAGIVLMMILPMFYALPQAAGISGAICLSVILMMVVQYRKHIKWKSVFLPAILFAFISTVSILLAPGLNPVIMKKCFGIFLIAVSAWYLIIVPRRKNEDKNLSLVQKAGCIIISGISDGLFGIGGPLMVVYYLAETASVAEYLGTMQAFFAVNNIWNTGVCFANGILTAELFPVILTGIAAILFGAWFAGKIVTRCHPDQIRKLTYLMIGISGILNVFM